MCFTKCLSQYTNQCPNEYFKKTHKPNIFHNLISILNYRFFYQVCIFDDIAQ